MVANFYTAAQTDQQIDGVVFSLLTLLVGSTIVPPISLEIAAKGIPVCSAVIIPTVIVALNAQRKSHFYTES